MWEIVLSAHLRHNREGSLVFRDWRKETGPRLHPKLGPLFRLAPPIAYFPDFLTPGTSGTHVDQAVDEVLSTPRRRLGSDVAILAAQQRLTPWITALGEGRAPALAALGTLLHDYHDAAIRPFWPTIVDHVEADRALRSRALMDGGTEGLLQSLRPMMRWNPPVLETDYPIDRELWLSGRGLILVPSYFCWRMPIALADPDLPPVLVYPVDHHLGLRRAGEDDADTALASLVGRTRAAALRAIENGCTTSELGRRVEISNASASQHASVLREAGLVTTQRVGGSVLHSLSPLGRALLRGDFTVPAGTAGIAAPSGR
jgi:DNA-binding transcriptional ArsR family regulator